MYISFCESLDYYLNAQIVILSMYYLFGFLQIVYVGLAKGPLLLGFFKIGHDLHQVSFFLTKTYAG